MADIRWNDEHGRFEPSAEYVDGDVEKRTKDGTAYVSLGDLLGCALRVTLYDGTVVRGVMEEFDNGLDVDPAIWEVMYRPEGMTLRLDGDPPVWMDVSEGDIRTIEVVAKPGRARRGR